MDQSKHPSMHQSHGSYEPNMEPARRTLSSTDSPSGHKKDLEDHDVKTKLEIRMNQPMIRDYRLIIEQQPLTVEASEYLADSPAKKINMRKRSAHAIEPIPIVELCAGNDKQTNSSLNINPLLFLYARLLPAVDGVDEREVYPNQLIGGHVASIFRYKKDKLPREHGYFMFQDLRVKFPGRYRIGFTLCEVVEDPDSNNQYVLPCAHVASSVFQVFNKGHPLPEPRAPTTLMKFIESGGAKLRYRKAQAKKPKKEEDWSASLSELNEGQRVKKKNKSYRPLPLEQGGVIEAEMIVPMTSSFGPWNDPNSQELNMTPGMQSIAKPSGYYPVSAVGADSIVSFVPNHSNFSFTTPVAQTNSMTAMYDHSLHDARYGTYQAPHLHQYPLQQQQSHQQLGEHGPMIAQPSTSTSLINSSQQFPPQSTFVGMVQMPNQPGFSEQHHFQRVDHGRDPTQQIFNPMINPNTSFQNTDYHQQFSQQSNPASQQRYFQG